MLEFFLWSGLVIAWYAFVAWACYMWMKDGTDL